MVLPRVSVRWNVVCAGIKPTREGYDGFVEMSEAIMKGRSPEQQRQTVLQVLNSVLPGIIPWAARNFFRPTELTCFLCAFFAHAGFAWVCFHSLPGDFLQIY